MAKIFIAYSNEDMRVVMDFSNKLQEADHKVFVAAYSIEGGKKFRDVIQEKLTSVNAFVPLISNNFIESEEAKSELNYAVGLANRGELRILPVLINDIPYAQLPFYVANIQYIPFQAFELQVERLLLELSSHEDYLSSTGAFERYIKSRDFSSEELASLGQQALGMVWAEQNDGVALIVNSVIKILRKRREDDKALVLYGEYVQRIPQRNSLWIGRSKVYFDCGRFPEADQDCEVVINQDPQNMIALLRRIEIRQAWALRTTSADEKQEVVQSIKDCLNRLNELPAATQKYLSGYLRALAIGAELCDDHLYANRAKELLTTLRSRIERERNGNGQRAVLKSLTILERFYENTGEMDVTNELERLRENLEKKWGLYRY